MYRVIPVPTIRVPEVWDIAEPFIKKALEHSNGECDINRIKSETYQGQRQLWLVAQDTITVAACLTRIVHYHNYFSVMFDFLSGDNMKDWVELLDKMVCGWTKTIGGKRVEIVGRKGFEKTLNDHGYKTSYYYLTKEV